MTQHLPIACTLSADDLAARQALIRTVSHEALIDKQQHGPRAVLRFAAGAGVRERVAEIVAAEADCCAFLKMELADEPDAIRLTIEAPADAEPVLDELLQSFEPIRPTPATQAA
jgi:hypothetical protein